MKKILPLVLFILNSITLFAQDVDMADNFRRDGKIYVVIAVILLILVGIFVYLIRLDMKLRKIEKQRMNH
jgi:hypothetical protein